MKNFWNEISQYDKNIILTSLVITTVLSLLVGCIVGLVFALKAGFWFLAIPCAFVLLFAVVLLMVASP